MKEKIEIIENMINEIREKAIETYTSKFDENAGLSIEDWRNGNRNTIKSLDGTILKYISYDDFKDLYCNIENNLYMNDKLTEPVLDKIIAYLKEESNYTDYYNLNKDCYEIEDFQ